MQDCFKRDIEYLRVSLTASCNLRCIYCMPENGCAGKDEPLTQAQFGRLIELICSTGIKKVRLTGGEPLLYPNLIALINKIKAMTQVKEIGLTTNGILLEDNAQLLKKAGLDSANVSLDCMNKNLFAQMTRGGDIDRVLNGIMKAKNIGIKLKINSVILQDINEQEIIPLINFAQQNKILLRFIELMPINVAQKYQGISEAIVLQKLAEIFGSGELLAVSNSPAHYYKFAGLAMPIGFISALSHKFCRKCNRIRLTSTGLLKPCLYDSESKDLKRLLDTGASDEKIMQAIKETIYYKPQCHHFDKASSVHKETRSMSLIGG